MRAIYIYKNRKTYKRYINTRTLTCVYDKSLIRPSLNSEEINVLENQPV